MKNFYNINYDLDNLWEYENGTIITDTNTDHDGINDCVEFTY